MRISRLSWVVLALCACGGGGGAASSGPTGPTGPSGPGPTTPAPSTGSVAMRTVGDGYGDYIHSFDPTQVTIARGGSVTWNNATGEVHNVTFSAATGVPANIPNHSAGANQRTFSVSGTFSYSCTNHSGMAGQVSVQ